MEVWEKVDYLLKEKQLDKKVFIKRLLSLEPRLKRTGEIPTEQTLYRYLNGTREIKVELIPYIAEALEVNEQELFTDHIEYVSDYNVRYSKDAREILDLLQYAPQNIVEQIKTTLYTYKDIYEDETKKLS